MISSSSVSHLLVPKSFQHRQLFSAWKAKKSPCLIPASSSPQKGKKKKKYCIFTSLKVKAIDELIPCEKPLSFWITVSFVFIGNKTNKP